MKSRYNHETENLHAGCRKMLALIKDFDFLKSIRDWNIEIFLIV